MTDAQELSRRRMRALRARARKAAEERGEQTRRAVEATICNCRNLLSDPQFLKLLQSMGVQDAPKLLLRKPIKEPIVKSPFGDPSLDFVIAWSFFKPLVENPVVARYLSEKKPGFVMEMKDAFISLVLHGPFPAYDAVGRPARSPLPSIRQKAARAKRAGKAG